MSASAPSRTPRGALLALAATAVAAALLLGPVATAPATRILGRFQSEAATHAPVLAAALRGVGKHGLFVYADHPIYTDAPTGAMFEPTTLLALLPTFRAAGGDFAGFALAWNVWLLGVLVATALGTWIWARAWLGERDPEGWGAGAATAIAAGSLFLHLAPEAGRTEAMNYPIWALHGGLLFHAARRGGRAWLGPILSVVPVIWSGGYATVFFAVAEPLVALWALATFPRRGTVVGLALVAVAAGLAVAPMALALERFPYVGVADRDASQISASVPLATLFTGGTLLQELPGYEVAPFAGAVALLAAALAPARARAALVPFGIAAFLAWVAAGPTPTVGETGVPGPTALLGAIPGPFALVRGWSRIVAFAVPLFGVAAAGLVAGRAVPAALLAALALVETGVRTAPHSSWWTLEHDATALALRARGEVVIDVPLDGLERTRRLLRAPTGPDPWIAMKEHVLFRYFHDTLPNEPELFRNPSAAPSQAWETCALRADAAALRAKGFTALYLRRDFLPDDGWGIAQRALRDAVGTAREEGVWALPDAVDAVCAPKTLATHGEEGAERVRPRTPEEREAIRAERQAERERLKEMRERIRAQDEGRSPEAP